MDVIDADAQNKVGVLGATSLVGTCLLPLLRQQRWLVTAYSRGASGPSTEGVTWRRLPLEPSPSLRRRPEEDGCVTPHWICVAPVWVLLEHFGLLEAQGAQRVVVLSSTSLFTKDDSSDPHEQSIARRLADAETRVQAWAQSHAVEWIVLRPTLIYGLGRDKNIAEIARFIRRFGFFPLLGKATGLRQPVHVADVVGACLAALQTPGAVNRAYTISGGETLTYREMVGRIFAALGWRPRLLTVPLWAFRLAVTCVRCLPRYRDWSAAMAERMNRDLVFDHGDAARDLDFKPMAFRLTAADLPR